MDAIRLFETIEKVSGRNDKEDLLNEADEIAKKLLLLAMDPYVTYGVKNIPYLASCVQEASPREETLGMYVAELQDLLEGLRTRALVGNDARDAVESMLSTTPPAISKWFYRIILKDMNMGVTAKTVNKVFPDLIPSFEVQLAEDLKGELAKVVYPLWSDFKLDGVRMLAVKDAGVVTLFSRKGHVVETLPTVAALLTTAPADNFVLDGEAMGASWNESQATIFATKNKVSDADMFFNVFDCIDLDDWKARKSQTPYEERREDARYVVTGIANTHVRLVGGVRVNNEKELKAFYAKALEQGHEGIMLKRLAAPYQFKRSRDLLKMKPHATWEGRVTGFAQGDINSKWVNSLGSFAVQFKEGGPITDVGGGYTDAQREEFMALLRTDPHHFDSAIMEVKGQELTKDGLVRFPVFVRFRAEGDKS